MRLGSTGTRVSQFALGTWHLPGSGERDQWGIEKVDREEMAKIVKKAYDAGINFIDTANLYHGRMQDTDPQHAGNSERLLGELLKGYDRESLVLATKVRGALASWPNGEGLSLKHILWQARESLARLQIDYIDLYQIHWPDQETPKARNTQGSQSSNRPRIGQIYRCKQSFCGRDGRIHATCEG